MIPHHISRITNTSHRNGENLFARSSDLLNHNKQADVYVCEKMCLDGHNFRPGYGQTDGRLKMNGTVYFRWPPPFYRAPFLRPLPIVSSLDMIRMWWPARICVYMMNKIYNLRPLPLLCRATDSSRRLTVHTQWPHSESLTVPGRWLLLHRSIVTG